jgi:superfamily I DNA and RNA helicase
MEGIKKEVERVVENEYQLRLTVPTADQLRHIRNIHRDMTSDQLALVQRGKAGFAALAQIAGQDDSLLDAVLAPLGDDDRERLIAALRAALRADHKSNP